MTLETSVYGSNVNVVLDPYLVNNLDQTQLSKLQDNLTQNNDMVADLMNEMSDYNENEVTETLKQKIDKKLVKFNVLEVKEAELSGSQLVGVEYLDTRINQCKAYLERSVYGMEGFFENAINKTKDFFSFTFNSTDGVSNTLTRLLSVIEGTNVKKLTTELDKSDFEMFNVKGTIPKDLYSEISRFVKTMGMFTKDYFKIINEQQTYAEKSLDYLENNIEFLESLKITSEFNANSQKIADYIYNNLNKRPRFKQCSINYPYPDDNNIDLKTSVIFPGNYCFSDVKIKNLMSVRNGNGEFKKVENKSNSDLYLIVYQYITNEYTAFVKMHDQPEYKHSRISVTKEQAIKITKELFELLEILKLFEVNLDKISPGFLKSFKAGLSEAGVLGKLIRDGGSLLGLMNEYYVSIYAHYKSSCNTLEHYIFKLIKAWNNVIYDCLEESDE